jgi:tetratricopeptide (TPR) repeat protein
VGLGLGYNAIGEQGLSAEYARKAYALLERLTDWEKFDVSAQYFSVVTGQIAKVLEVDQVWSQDYPRDWIPHERLGVAYAQLGQHENALAQFQQARQLGENTIVTNSLVTTSIRLDRVSDAKAIVNQALAGNPDHLRFHQAGYLLGFLDGDRSDMQREVAWGMHKHGAEEALMLSLQSDTEAYFGRLESARDLSRRAEESAIQNDLGERASLMHATEAVREAEFGNTEAARRQARIALAAAPGPDSQALAALALAKAGGTAQARKLMDQLNTAFPSSTLIQNYWLPTIAAEIQVQAGNASRAVELLQPAGPYELADTLMPTIPVYVHAEAFLRSKQGDAAAAEFQKILQHRGLAGNSVVAILADLGLARAYALSGNTSKARTKYQDFFTLWKDADVNVPMLRAAKTEFATMDLRASSGTR